jgi:hypothetical protein
MAFSSPRRPRRRPRFPRSAALAASLLGLVMTGLPATAAPAEPQVRLVAATGAITIDRFEGEPAFADLGTNVVAGRDPLEVRVTRKSYRDPIVARQVLKGGKTRTVPRKLAPGFEGFAGFLHVTLTDASGTVVTDETQPFCPNGWVTARTRPDAPATSPYPEQCAANPFTLGTVWGIQAGWGVNTSASGTTFDVPDGTYTAVTEITAPFRSFFKIPAAQARATVEVTIRTTEGDGHEEHSLKAERTPPSARAAAPKAGPRPRGVASVPAGPKPDLRSLPAYGIQVTSGEDETGTPAEGDYLAFAADVWNAGPSRLTVDGFRRPGTGLMDAYQYFYDTKGEQVGWAPTGTLEYDTRDGHSHWHFTDFARYSLLAADKKEVVRSGKEAFCLAPTDAIDLTVKGANWKPASTGLGSACGDASSLAIRETLDVGWGDTYEQFRPGQSFEITGLPNGTYWIQVLANPDNRLYERSRSNNTSLRKVVLGGTPGARTVTVPPYQGIDA